MPLDEYRRKRDFSRSPEPSGAAVRTAKRRKGLLFSVQKHLATQLHYDLRLEHNGVLLSWAVPKGPSLDPSIKRLAMHVEDHPIEYGSFEGVIPEGYGAGVVMLWDTGTWTPEVSDVDAALARGDLKFTLDGYKLKGSWALVRTRGYGKDRGDSRSWLLIKHRDDWAGDLDIAAFAPLSVKSEQDFHEILAADAPALWHSGRPAGSGESIKRFTRILEQAAALKASRQPRKPTARVRKTEASTPRPRSAKTASTAPAKERPSEDAGSAPSRTRRTKKPARR